MNELLYSQSDDPYWKVITYVAILVVSFLHFVVSSFRKTMTEAVYGLFVATVAFFLVMTNQPLLVGLAWLLLLAGTLRVMMVLWQINYALAVITPGILLLISWLILYNYDFVKDSDLAALQFFTLSLVTIVLAAIRLAVTFFELSAITRWGRVISIAIIVPIVLISWGLAGMMFWDDPKGWSLLYRHLLNPLLWVPLGIVLLSGYSGWQSVQDHPNYRAIRDRGIWFTTFFGWFGTRFQRSDLTGANFTAAILNNANFAGATLKHARWHDTRGLEFACWGRSYLRYPRVRQLFAAKPRRASGKPNGKAADTVRRFDQCDLRGIRLSRWESEKPDGQPSDRSSFHLQHASFRSADLSHADLRGVDLTDANLVGARLLGTHLDHSNLTGVCIQDWHINCKTTFEHVHCDHLYLREATPGNPDRVKVDDLEHPLNTDYLQALIMPIAEQKKLDQLYADFAKIDLIKDKTMREFRLTQAATQAEKDYDIGSELYRQLFDDYHKQKILSERRHSWWQSFLWFKVEPWIEKINKQTQDLDIFPLLENLGRLSILVAVVTFVNSVLKPDVNVEQQYRPWEMIRADNENVRGVSRIALEQLRAEGSSLVGLKAKGVDLTRINLSNANLNNADLSFSQLQLANLSQTSLKNASLVGANLTKAYLGYSGSGDSSTQGMGGTITHYLPPVMKQGADLEEANLQKANLTEATFDGADLKAADFQKANLTGATFVDARNADMATFKGAFYIDIAPVFPEDLKIEDMAIWNISPGSNLSEKDLSGLDLRKVDLSNANLVGADLRGAKLQGAILKGAKFSRTTEFPHKFQPREAGMVPVPEKP